MELKNKIDYALVFSAKMPTPMATRWMETDPAPIIAGLAK